MIKSPIAVMLYRFAVVQMRQNYWANQRTDVITELAQGMCNIWHKFNEKINWILLYTSAVRYRASIGTKCF